jgi:hypothetical protein
MEYKAKNATKKNQKLNRNELSILGLYFFPFSVLTVLGLS